MKILNALDTREFFELLDRSDANDFLTISRHPDWDRVTPVSVTREAPITGINKPVVESLLLDALRNPSSGLVVSNEILLDVSDLNEPAVETTIDQRFLGSPAEWITMVNSSLGNETATLL